MSDEGLLEINKKHLNQMIIQTSLLLIIRPKTPFIVISHINRSSFENAHNESVSIENELARVMIHGILHCVGFNDKTEDDKRIMRSKRTSY